MNPEVVDAAAECAAELVRRGYPPTEAVRISVDSAIEVTRRRGGVVDRRSIGAVTDIVSAAASAEPVKQARELVSPWLWIFSVISFGMAVANYQKIEKMFSKWKRGRRAS